MMLLLNVGTILLFLVVLVCVVARLPILRYLRVHGRTRSLTYDLLTYWDKTVA